MVSKANEDEIGVNEDYNRIAMLAASLTREELLELDVDTILRRLFWEEKVLRFEPQTPRFACTCSRERVANMIRGLGQRGGARASWPSTARSTWAAISAASNTASTRWMRRSIFTAPGDQPPVSPTVQ